MKASFFPNSAALVLIALALGSLLLGQPYSRAHASASVYDLLITNARIVDGSDNPWFRADVAVRHGRVARIGHVASDAAKRSISTE